MPTDDDTPDRVHIAQRRLKGLDDVPVGSQTSGRSFTHLGAVLGFALSLALAVATTTAHAATWTSSTEARLFGKLVAQCPS